MGGRQSKRSVDITTTPKKEGIPAEGGVVGDAAAPGDGKLERIEETDTKPTTNGIAPRTDVAEDVDKDKDDAAEKEKGPEMEKDAEKGKEKEKETEKETETETEKEKSEEVKAENSNQETKAEASGESAAEATEVTTPTEVTATSPSSATSPDSKETKKKEKPKKKWSFRSISFSKKDKTKPAREEPPKNGDVTKEEPLAEGGEEAESASATAGSPAEDKSGVSSPLTAEKETTPAECVSEGNDEGSVTPATSSPADEKKEEPTPSAPTPVPVEEKKEEVEKIDAEKKVVEVSPAGGQSIVDPVQVCRVQPVTTLSIIERKTSEDVPSLPPSSPPPTPIDPSPLQQAQQAQATAKALAEALKLPVETVPEESIPLPQVVTTSKLSSEPDRSCNQTKPPAQSSSVPPRSSIDEPPLQAASAPPKVEALPVVVGQEKDELSSSKSDQNPLPILDTAAESADVIIASETSPSLSETNATEDIRVDVPPQPVSECQVENRVKREIKEKEEEEEAEAEAEAEEKGRVNVTDCQVQEKVESAEEAKDAVPDSASGPTEETKAKVVADTIKEDVQVIETVVEEISTTPDGEVVSPDPVEGMIMKVIEPLGDIGTEGVEDMRSVREQSVIELTESKTELVVETEEDSITLAEEEIVVVEAKPAVVIPAEEVMEEILKTTADASKVEGKPIETIEHSEDKEIRSAVPTGAKDVPVSQEAEDTRVPEIVPENLSSQIIEETVVIVESPVTSQKDVIEIIEVDKPLPLSPQNSPVPNSDMNEKTETATVPSPTVDTSVVVSNSSLAKEENSDTVVRLLAEPLIPPPSLSPESNAVIESSASPSAECQLENVSDSSDDLPSAATEPVECLDLERHSSPPEEFSSSLPASNVSDLKNELPVPGESTCRQRNATETLLTPPRSPSPQLNVSIEASMTTSRKESMSISPKLCDESEIELKERLAEPRSEKEESISCQLSNSTTTTANQETHQSIPEPEVPVENNVAHEVSTTESLEEAPKAAPPAVPVDAPASPPSAPAITEDVASVTKAIEEIEISDKAVAAAAIECNTVEIIADATHQNNINE